MSVHELLLLGLLADGEAHGYELHEFLAEKLHFLTDLTRPTAYRLLDRLHQEGFLDREIEREGKRPERMRYRITERGRARLDELLEERLSTLDVLKPEGNVGLLFMQRLPKAQAARLLRARKVQLEARLVRMEAHHDELPAHSPTRLVLERNAGLVRADIEFFERVSKRLEREAQAGDDAPRPAAKPRKKNQPTKH